MTVVARHGLKFLASCPRAALEKRQLLQRSTANDKNMKFPSRKAACSETSVAEENLNSAGSSSLRENYENMKRKKR